MVKLNGVGTIGRDLLSELYPLVLDFNLMSQGLSELYSA